MAPVGKILLFNYRSTHPRVASLFNVLQSGLAVLSQLGGLDNRSIRPIQ